MRVAVAGATGKVGAHVVAELGRGGYEVVRLSRTDGVDLTTGDGLADRLAGADAVIDCLSVVTTRRRAAVSFFETTTRTLLDAERAAGVGHHVVLSIVGADRVQYGYYEGKVAQERLVRESGRPYTILRATQFHEFAEQLLERFVIGRLALVPRGRSAPVAATEVATALVELAADTPRAEHLELTGPGEHDLADMVQQLVAVRRLPTRAYGLRLPGAGARAMREGALLSEHPWRVGTQTYDEWLRERAVERA
ncbi:NAD(P)H-binding protein [Luteipulveratus sp. YIM 133132]|uniref:SDR family oxidoreductase n=1 Tax=Luteipulveratus flavus TaxID=3031728 RepID=UPI0023B05D33|nr:NAD(P)H-binding protein [Luteipulveratus sp. YIM 133132]MDE9365396.1 NAD(P)H-binding protein [Luteipulveratus sp. YIM 133132]